MALTIHTTKDEPVSKLTVDRRLWLAADRETLVEDGDSDAAFLWATEGREVSEDEAKRVGYKPKTAKVEPPAKAEKRTAAKKSTKG